VDACRLVTRDEAQNLAKTPLDPATKSAAACTYFGPTSGPTAQVEVYVGDGAKNYLDVDRADGHALTPISGIGDEAYEEANSIFLRKADLWIALRLVLLNDPAENRMPLEDLARIVVTRI
jgi:hypothetical protein